MCVLLSASVTTWCFLASFNSYGHLYCPQDVECTFTCGGSAELGWKFVYLVWYFCVDEEYITLLWVLLWYSVPALVLYLHWVYSSTVFPVLLQFFFCNLATTLSDSFTWFQPSWFSYLEYFFFLSISGETLWFTWGSASSDILKQRFWWEKVKDFISIFILQSASKEQ